MYKLVIFDCDGVLIDSEIIAARIEAEEANKIGHPITAHEVCARFAGRPARLVWETICHELGRDFSEDLFRNSHDKIVKAFESELQIVAEVDEVLKSLIVPFCVASTTRMENLRKNLRTTGLFDFFEPNIFSASQVEKPKPAPDVFLFAAKNMGFEPHECLVIEDSLAGVTAARAANMQVYGFCGASHIVQGHDSQLLAAGAAKIFNNYQDLMIELKHYNLIVPR